MHLRKDEMHIEGNLNNREVIMKLSDFKKFIPTDRYLDEVEINPMEFMEQITFREGSARRRRGVPYDYRKEALERMIKDKMSFTSTCNSTPLVYEFINATCPSCGERMEYTRASGCGGETQVSYRCCTCKTELTLCLENFYVNFKE